MGIIIIIIILLCITKYGSIIGMAMVSPIITVHLENLSFQFQNVRYSKLNR